jgi:hypothetical protein
MQAPRRLVLISGISALFVSTAFWPVAASGVDSHSHTASVNFNIPISRVSAANRFQVKYSSKYLPRTSSLLLQWEVGTAHVWKTVQKLKGTSGTADAPGVSTGKYVYRIDAQADHRAISFSVDRLLFAYGNIPFLTFCIALNQAPGGVGSNDGLGCRDGNIQIGSTDYTYAANDDQWVTYPSYAELVNVSKSTCRSVSISFGDPNDSSYVQIVQSSSNPETSSAGDNAVAQAKLPLDGGPWILNAAEGSGESNIYFNGTLSCYSITGLS